MKEYLNIVLTGDKNYVYPLGVAMTSVLSNISDNYMTRFFLFVSDFTSKDKAEILKIKKLKKCEIIFYDMAEYNYLFSSIDISTFELKYISLATYYRLLLLKILPEDVKKCFYIDGDMIVDADISTIYEQMPNSKLASVVIEVLAMANKESTLKHLNEMSDFRIFQKNPFLAPYFNAGFFLLNIAKAKRLKLFEAAFDYLKRYPNPPYADQDTLNAIIGQKYHKDLIYLSPAYNVFCDIDYDKKLLLPNYEAEDLSKAFQAPKIYHYAGGNKPWINNHVKHFYEIWWNYARKSPWYQKIKKCKKSHKNITIVLLFNLFPLISIEQKNNGNSKLIRIKLFNLFSFCKIKFLRK